MSAATAPCSQVFPFCLPVCQWGSVTEGMACPAPSPIGMQHLVPPVNRPQFSPGLTLSTARSHGSCAQGGFRLGVVLSMMCTLRVQGAKTSPQLLEGGNSCWCVLLQQTFREWLNTDFTNIVGNTTISPFRWGASSWLPGSPALEPQKSQ